MKKILLISSLVLGPLLCKGQDKPVSVTGKVSYVSTVSTYVRFSSTDGISQGDTLFIPVDSTLEPALVVTGLSSVSCVCNKITSHEVSEGHLVVAMIKGSDSQKTVAPVQAASDTSSVQHGAETEVTGIKKRENGIKGSLSVNSYSELSNTDIPSLQRFRYTLSLSAHEIGGSRFSFETYTSFRHKAGEWEEVKADIFSALKIYSLAIKYDFSNTTMIAAGRWTDPVISNMGAMDGLLFRKKAGSFSFGLIAGSRPDYADYSLNPKLFQYGGYVALNTGKEKGTTSTSLAFVEQTNDFKTDRRFIFLQHSNNLIDRVSLIASAEIDLYRIKDNVSSSSPDLTGLYVLLTWRPSGKFSFSGSYDARKNVMYYETYKTFTERITEESMRQGFRVNGNWRINRSMSAGLTAGMRYLPGDPLRAVNASAYYSWYGIPLLDVTATLSGIYYETSYAKSAIGGLNLSKEFAEGRLQAGAGYRMAHNSLAEGAGDYIQNIAEASLTWIFKDRTSFGAYYEGTFENASAFHSVYLQLRRKF